MSDHKDMTHRHLRHKLQSLGRRLDELEEATNKLQKSEDELLDLQDKIIQAEGSNSSLLGDVEALRKRLLKIQGKDEEVRKAEDLCRTVREKLEEEENLTKELKAEIERLQRRMAELEKLEEAFGKSKSDCSQLCLNLNEEKNLTKKLSSELEALKARLKEVEGSEVKLDKAEQALTMELEKLKGFTQTFVSERKRLLEKQREDEKTILKLTEQLEQQKNRLGMSADPGRADFMRSRIEDELASTGLLTSKLTGRNKGLDYLKLADDNIGLMNKSQNEKNSTLEGSQEEDNKVKELTLEVERLKNRLKQLEIVEEDLKSSESKNGELHEKFQMERNRARQLSEQVEQLRTQLCGKVIGGNGPSNVDKLGNGSSNICLNSPAKVLENGKAENEEVIMKSGFRQEKPKHRNAAAVSEPSSPKHRNRELSPQHRREAKLKKELSHSDESSPKSARRPLSPAHKSRRTPKTPTTAIPSDNGLRGTEEKTRGTTYSSVNTPSSDIKKVSVLSRYPPAANDQKPLRSAHKQPDGESKKSRVEKFSKLYVGSDSESNNSDIVPDSTGTVNSISALDKDAASVSDQESLDQVQEPVSVTSSLSKANGSYTAYRSHVTPLLPTDQGSEGHSSASETESTGSRPSEPEPVTETPAAALSSRITTSRFPRYSHVHESHSEGSSSRSSFDEELHSRTHSAEGGHQGPVHTTAGIEIQRVCSPREALRSKAVIKPAIVEIDRKEMMISESLSTNGKPKISTKPIVTTTSKMTSSITIYPNDPSSSRTSSRSSSLSSEPAPIKERHTSTSNILIGPSSEHHGSISVPYEISIPKSDITLRSCQDQDCGGEGNDICPSGSKHHSTSRMETTTSHLCCQRSKFSLQSLDATSADFNDTESGFESSSSSSTATVTSWRSPRQSHLSTDDGLPDMRNVTVRSTWRNKGTPTADEMGRGRGGTRALTDGGSEDEAETSTWRAYRATTIDTEESMNSGTGAGGNTASQRGAKPTPAEVYMRRINSVVTNTKEVEEPVVRRGKRSQSPAMEAGGLGRTIPHAPVTSQSWGRSYTPQPMAADNMEPIPNPSHSPASWRRHIPSSDSHHLGSSYDRTSKTTGASSRGELWSSRGQGSGARAEGRSSGGSRPWSHRQSEHH
ncbi:leucine zipper protein 1 [Sphaeramia orbicularis]|uniref:Leucine zipper protein 1 n=1 Tax=Sphaeramia orbicularis TaxID=375764 RepID=A0A673C7C0_9TELE|nr:leucine zipper protein 1 [Sphaeramia orbicularis]XP_029982687.1 leucine zipper protein 1 [Sphaeramia orbicularis]XP_029982689.1 leucine zipper protein 1 [Sphaeramia orbicularis]XP_029982690.1 leucine zipper protein 1 [Sphaeramia orbicularis]